MFLWQKILIGIILGVFFGYLAPEYTFYIKPFGEVFINMMKMIAVPLVFFSVVTGVASLDNSKELGEMGIKTIFLYLLTTAVAVTFGLVVGYLLAPGEGLNLQLAVKEVTDDFSIATTLVNIVPKNPISAFVEGNILQIIFFAVMFGISLFLIGSERNKAVVNSCNIIAETMFKMTGIVMIFAPIGVFAILANTVAEYGNVPGQETNILQYLFKLVLIIALSMVIYVVAWYGFLVAVFLRHNPVLFFKKILNAIVTAFSTSSSAATLPVTMKTAENKLGLSKKTTRFVLPLGATINMDGTAMFQAICIMFIAQAVNVDLSMAQIAIVFFTITFSSIGTASAPAAGVVMLTMGLSAVGLPIEAIGLIMAVERIPDMIRTSVNVTGDLVVTSLVDKKYSKESKS